MTDLATPTVVDPNPVNAQIASAMRDVGIFISFVIALLGFVGKRDLVGLIAYLQSAEALPALGLIVGSGLFLYRQWLVRHQRAVTVAAATSRPGTAVLVKGVNA